MLSLLRSAKKKTTVQGILFDRRYFDENKADFWLESHNWSPIKIHITGSWLMYRIKHSRLFDHYLTTQYSKGVLFRIGYYK